LGVINIERWDAAGRQGHRVLDGYHWAVAALPWRDRLARRWEEAAGWSLLYRIPAYAVAEAAAHGYLHLLLTDEVSATADHRLGELMTAARDQMLTQPLRRGPVARLNRGHARVR
jgi:hypothetical protein